MQSKLQDHAELTNVVDFNLMSTDSELRITIISSKMQNMLQFIKTAIGCNCHILLLGCNSFQKTQSNCATKYHGIMYTSRNMIKPTWSTYLIFLLVNTNAFSPACNVVRNSVSCEKGNKTITHMHGYPHPCQDCFSIYAPILVPCNTNTNFNITAEISYVSPLWHNMTHTTSKKASDMERCRYGTRTTCSSSHYKIIKAQCYLLRVQSGILWKSNSESHTYIA